MKKQEFINKNAREELSKCEAVIAPVIASALVQDGYSAISSSAQNKLLTSIQLSSINMLSILSNPPLSTLTRFSLVDNYFVYTGNLNKSCGRQA